MPPRATVCERRAFFGFRPEDMFDGAGTAAGVLKPEPILSQKERLYHDSLIIL